ncbi:PD40 domain-containing protein, partial [candidate division KSB1 bacterium]|nr:PD40 domain-containing protein [candidate division KSB1 bacterium]
NGPGKILVIDSTKPGNMHFYEPSYSSDGEYVLFSKSSDKNYQIFVWSVSKKSVQKLIELKFSNSKKLDQRINPFWSPKQNQVVWVDWLADRKSLNSIDIAGKKNQVLFQAQCEKLVPVVVPNHDRISFIIQNKENQSLDGLWSIRSNGTDLQQIYKGDEIQAHQWSPDGRKIAVIREIEVNKKDQKKTYQQFELSIADSTGHIESTIFQYDREILDFDWSPDGQKIAVVTGPDSLKNIWKMDVATGTPVKVTFDNVDRYFGWGNNGEIYFTIKPENNLPVLSPLETELRDISNSLYAKNQENRLIQLLDFKPDFIEENIRSFSSHPTLDYAAYYKVYETGLFGSTHFCPIVKLPAGIQMIARDEGLHQLVADEMYLAGKYQLALDHLNQAFAMDFLVDSTIEHFSIKPDLKIQPDSIQKKILQEKFIDIPLMKLVLILRKMGKIELANAYFGIYHDYLNFQLNNKNTFENKLDESNWQLLSTYTLYRAFAEGIQDMDELLESLPEDSAYISTSCVVQAVLAVENGQSDLGLDKLKKAILMLPANGSDSNDFPIILSLIERRLEPGMSDKLISVCELAVSRLSKNEKIFELYEFLGDRYRKKNQFEKAYSAYQQAAATNPDGHEVWEKLFVVAQENKL